MYTVSVHCRFFGLERVCVSLFEPSTVPVHRARPSTTCTSCLPAEHGILGHQAISLVRMRGNIIIIIIIIVIVIMFYLLHHE